MGSNSIGERLANLSPAKRALLEVRLKEKGLETLARRTIPLRASREFARLSFAQQRLWFLNQLEPENPVYNEPRAVRLTGVLDVAALKKALNRIIVRHEILRTTIVLVDSNPMQQIKEAASIDLPLIDLRGQAVQDRETEARRLIDEAVRRPFNLSRDLMLRVLLLRLEAEQHILVLVNHHIASDGWSSGVFWQELTALYEAYISGGSVVLRELPVQYADYAAWQREWLQGEALETQVSYWRKQLDSLATLQLTTDRPRPVIQSFSGAKQIFILSHDLSRALRELSHTEESTLFMILLAAFQSLLYRYTGQEDIAIGSPIAGRNRVEIEGLIGFFVNTLVLRTAVSGSLTFRELLERVRAVCLGAYSHQDLPFEKLVEELQPRRNFNYNPLFQITFQLNNVPRPLLKLPAIEVEDMELESEISKFDLSLSLSDRGEDIRGRLHYSTDLFDESTITRMLGHFQVLLEGIVADPDRRISDLPILTEAEKHQLLVEWNETERDYPKDKCIHELFEAHAEKTPDTIAVLFGDQQLTYEQLNRRANQLAHYLKNLGVGPEVRVGICLERSPEMIVSLLAILKAGGAYVPLDPHYPQERLAFMLEDSEARVLITQRRYAEAFSNGPATIISLDTDRARVFDGTSSRLATLISSDGLAYVIYTSGSTGKPKGVAVSHQAVSRLVMNTDYMQIVSTDIVAQSSNISFDAATFEIWGALLNGAGLVVFPKEILLSAKAISEAIETCGVTVMFLTTALFNQMVEQIPVVLGKLHNLLFGGETADPHRVRELLHRGPPRRLLHVYGPTETTTFASWCEIKEMPDDAATVPIGRPIANTQIYLLDPQLTPVPLGIPGEIYIGGPGLARGYCNRPELTAEKFVANPYRHDPASRLYRTGDRARYLPDGNIEFLGRIDNQVKIRGYRIELGEIQAVLCQHWAVQQASVQVREDVPGDKRLVAYLVGGKEKRLLEIGDLLTYLRSKLPDYMIPSAFVSLESLPLTTNGKVDAGRLPLPEPVQQKEFVAPRTPTEELLGNIWAEVLKLERVGIHDNFFELGGHSLLATRVVSRVREMLRIELPLRALFETPTVASLSDHIEPMRWAGNKDQVTAEQGSDQEEEIRL